MLFVIVKPDVVNKNESLLNLFEINLDKTHNLLSAKNINIGFVASVHTEKLVKKDAISSAVRQFSLISIKM